MITPQDIREKAFDRAVRGYDMEAVDEFLDELAVDYSTLAKENTTLKSKMRVLVEKIEEYRQTEDSMRLALLSAQKLSAQIETEAKEKAEKMLQEAKAQAEKMLVEAKGESEKVARESKLGIENELAKLSEAQKATKKYVDHMTAVCQKQIEFYAKLSEAQLVSAPKAAEEPKEEPKTEAVEDTVRAIEDSAVKAALAEPEEKIELDGLEDDGLDATRLFSTEETSKRRKSLFDDID